MKTNITGIIDNVAGATISVSPGTLSMESIGGSTQLSINCKIGWKIIDLPDFVSVSDVRGHGNKTISVVFTENRSTTASRSGSFKIKSSRGEIITVSVSQSKATIDWVYTFSVSPASLSFVKTGETKTVSASSYKTPYIHGTISGSSVDVSYTSSSSETWCSVTGDSILVSENPNTSSRVSTVTFKQNESSQNASVSVTQAASTWTWKYGISISPNSWTSAAVPSTKDITVSAWRQKYLNGRITDTQVAVGYSISNNLNFVSVTKTSTGATVSTTNNTTSSSRSGSFTITPTLDNTTSYPLEGTNTSATFTVTQEAGVQIYSDVTATLSYSANVAATGGTCSPTLNYSQTYTWNGISGSGGNVSPSSFSIGNYTMQSTSASINATSGVVTWGENKSLNTRTSGTISVMVTGLGGKQKTVTSSCGQNAGSYTYGNITISKFLYSPVSAVGGTSSPAIEYSQPYGWNGATSGAGTVYGNGDDAYTTYVVSTAQTGLSVASDTGIVTWAKNNPTPGSQDTSRSGAITATVSRNGKAATKATNTVQEEETITSYSEWSFTLSANTSLIAATGGGVTFTLSRPTRTITYNTGDTRTETAQSGTFALTRSNSNFTLSSSSISMTSSSLPQFSLSVGATGTAAVAAISSTVTAAFTATNPTTGTTTKSVTSGAITREESKHTSTNYRINQFSVGASSFNAAANSTTLTIVTQRQYVYTGDQKTNWSSFNPGSGLTITCGTGGSAGTITYGNPSTCTISVAANTGSARTITVSGSYSGGGSGSITLSQSADEIISTAYSNVTAGGITNSTIPASGTTTNYTATAGNGSQVLTYSWRSGKANTTETKTISPSHSSISATASSKGATASDVTTVKSQAVTWSSLDGVSSKNATGTMYIYQAANKANNSSAITTWGTPSVSIGSGITAAGGSASVSVSVTNKRTYYYTSGSPGDTVNEAGNYTDLKINSQFITSSSSGTSGTSISRYSLSKTTLSHSSMGVNAGYDCVRISAANANSSSTVGYSAYTRVYNEFVRTDYGGWSYTWTKTDESTRTRSVTDVWTSGNYSQNNQTETGGTRYLALNKEEYNGAAQHTFEANGAGSATFTIISHDYWGSSYIHNENISGASCSCNGFTCSVSGTTLTVTAPHLSTTPTDAKRATVVVSKSGFVTRIGYTYIEQKANVRSVSSVYFVPFKPDASWIVDVVSGKWSTVPASGGYVKCNGYVNYIYTSGSALNDQHVSGDAALTWSTGHGDWITNHVNGGYYINHRYTNEGAARSSTATWTYDGVTSSGLTLTQQENYASVSSYGSWEAVTSWSSWADYDYPYADTHSGYWASVSIGNGITAAGGSATVSKSAGHTIYHYKRQRRSATQYRDINYVWTSGSTWTHDNGSSQIVYDYQQVSNGSSAASDNCTIAIVSNGNNRFSLSGTTLSHSSMGKDITTDTCTIRCTNSANTSATKDASVSVTNTVGSWYDNGSWGGWSDTGSAYYVGSEWEGSGSDYWASCSIGSGITAGASSATISASAGHTRNFYKSRNIATIRYMPTRRNYTSGDYDVSSRSETSARAYDSVWQRNAATSDTPSLSEVVDNNGRFSISGTTLNHSTMGTNATTDNCTVRCTNASATSVYKDASVSVSNSKSYTTYSDISVSIGDVGANGGGTGNPTTTYAYNYKWTSGVTGKDWYTVTGRGNSGSEYVTYSLSGASNGASATASGSVSANSLGTTAKARASIGILNITYGGWGGGQAGSTAVTIYQAANAVTNSAYNAYNGSYWATCTCTANNITAAGGSATFSGTAGHTYYYQYLYTSGSVAPSHSQYYSSAVSDTAKLSLASNGNSRFSLSGGTLSHSNMTTNATTDTATVRCTNQANTSYYNDKSVSVTNSKNAGTYSISSSGNVSFVYATGGAPKYKTVSSYYKGTYTSGSSYSDWVDFSVSSKPSWAQVDKYAGSELQITVNDNSSVSPRSGTVTLLQSTSGKATSFTITQEGAPKTVYLIDVMPENDSNISIMFSEALSNPITLTLNVEDQRYWNYESIKVTLSAGSESYLIDVSDYSSLSRVDWVCVENIDYEGPEQIENYAQSC